MKLLRSEIPAAFLVCLSLLVACQVQEADPVNVRVTFIHAVPGAPGLDIFTDGVLLPVSPVSYPDCTEYVTLRAGLRSFQFAPNGSTELGNPVSVPLTEGQTYSLFLLPVTEGIQLLPLQDNLTPPAAGNIRLRFVNASPDAPAIKLGIAADTITILNSGAVGSAISRDNLAAGAYNFRLRIDTTLISSAKLTKELLTGKVYTIYAHGYVSPPPGSTDSLQLSIMQNF